MKIYKIFFAICCLAAVVCVTVSCGQKHTYDFSYSPSVPKTGQTVKFSNLSDAGESWVWKFGDGSQSTLKNPSHTYTTAGTYVVELMADSSKSRKVSHVLEVLDSLPSICVSPDSVKQYAPVTLKVSLYNPKNAKVTCLWELDESIFVFTKGDLTSDSIVGYFTDFGHTTDVELTVTIGDKIFYDERTLMLQDNPAPSLLMEVPSGRIWRQRIYEGVYETPRYFRGDEHVIEAANDSTATLNGVEYDIHNMPVLTDLNVLALQVDAINRKLYLILDDGVYVANANGDALTQITDNPAGTLLVDPERNSLYWSEAYGVWAMPLVTHPQNIISEQQFNMITLVNEIEEVGRMTIIY
jgi:hypothetical protein